MRYLVNAFYIYVHSDTDMLPFVHFKIDILITRMYTTITMTICFFIVKINILIVILNAVFVL